MSITLAVQQCVELDLMDDGDKVRTVGVSLSIQPLHQSSHTKNHLFNEEMSITLAVQQLADLDLMYDDDDVRHSM